MKTLILSTVLAISLSAHANQMNEYKAQKLFDLSHPEEHKLKAGDGELPNSTPAQMKVKITKNTFVKDTDSTYHFLTTPVCQAETNFLMLDFRKATQTTPTSVGNLSCDSTLDGKPISVSVSGVMELVNIELFDDEPKTDVKFAIADLTYSNTKSTSTDQTAFLRYTTSMSRDVKLKSYLFLLSPDVVCLVPASADVPINRKSTNLKSGSENGPCSLNEFFTATVELIDQIQMIPPQGLK